MKNNPSLTKQIRTVLEQSLVERLETLGINAVSSLTLGIFAVFVLLCFLNKEESEGAMSVLLYLETRGYSDMIH